MLGLVKGKPTKDGVTIEISTLRKSVNAYMILTTTLTFALLLLIAYLGKNGIVPVTSSLIVFTVAASGIFVTLAYESMMGVFPGTRRMRKEVMKASDKLISSRGDTATTQWNMVSQSVKIKKTSWTLKSGPDTVDPPEFTNE